MMIYWQEKRALACNRHAKPIVMKVGEVINRDGSVDVFISCPKCYCVYSYPESLAKSFERMNQVADADEQAKNISPISSEKVADTIANTLLNPKKKGGKRAKAGTRRNKILPSV